MSSKRIGAAASPIQQLSPGIPPQQSASRYHCDICEVDVTHSFRVRCHVCVDYDMCVTCFIAGKQSGTHSNDHPYIPIGCRSFPIFTPDWTADEESVLLETVARVGLGNWQEVADNIAVCCLAGKDKRKKPEQCEKHFYEVHVLGRPLTAADEDRPPTRSIGNRQEIQESRIRNHAGLVGPWSPPPLMPLQAPPAGFNCSIVGYMPLRGDFDVEWNNDAELGLADITVRGDETLLERELQMEAIGIYNATLTHRRLRKRLMIEEGFADSRKLLAAEAAHETSTSAIDLLQVMRILKQYDNFLSPLHADPHTDIRTLVRLLLDEDQLYRRMEIIHEWRLAGLRSLEQVVRYEALRKSIVKRGEKVQRSSSNEDQPTASPLLLSEIEQTLCREFDLKPVHYMALKALTLCDASPRTNLTYYDLIVAAQAKAL